MIIRRKKAKVFRRLDRLSMAKKLCYKRTTAKILVAGIVLVSLVNFLSMNTYLLNRDEVISIRKEIRRALPNHNNDYMILPNIGTPEKENAAASSDFDIVICTHTFIDRLDYIMALSERWDGHISVAVSSYGKEIERTYQYIMLLRACSSDVRLKTRFHLVYPTSHPPVFQVLENSKYECSQLGEIREEFRKMNITELGLTYPINFLRNIAIVYSNSPYVFNIDIDLLPSKGFKNEMENYLAKTAPCRKDKKIAFVVPCFESNVLAVFDTKPQLLDAIKKGTVRQCAVKRCPPCQAPTNYALWTNLSTTNDLQIAYYVKHRQIYEPFFMAHRDHMPLYDARFVHYGFDRVSQVCEAYVAGLEFGVMNNAFIVHHGFQTMKEFVRWKIQSNQNNSIIFKTQFKPYLEKKYPKNKTALCL